MNFSYIIDQYNTQFGWDQRTPRNLFAKDIEDMKTQITKKWKVYLLSLGNITMDGAKITAPRIGLCSNEIDIN